MKKLTKRQRKIIKGPNAAAKRSLKEGLPQQVGTDTYYGDNPQYKRIGLPEAANRWAKVSKGVPFVRAEQKDRYIGP